MESGGTDGTELNGMPVILLTTVGAKTGKLRKTPLMRVEHNGEYAIVASLGGAPQNPVWYYNVAKNPRVELQDGTVTRDYDAVGCPATRGHSGGAPSGLSTRRLPKETEPGFGVRADPGSWMPVGWHGTIGRCPLGGRGRTGRRCRG
jgi:deazaflavin-dependent oxidoreductase (nitroreductase family)